MSDIPLPGGGTLKLWDSVYAPQQIEAAIGKGPIIQNGTWWLWDVSTMTYQDTGIALASGLGPGSVTTPMLADGSVTWPKLSQEARHSNPNLLDNWYFVGGGSQQGGGQFPINQRRMTEYTSVGYTIDRWSILRQAKLTIASDGILPYARTSGGVSFLSQVLENPSLYYGKTMTFSMLVEPQAGSAGGSINIGRANYAAPYGSANIDPTAGVQLVTTTAVVGPEFNNVYMVLFNTDEPAAIKLIAAKLEKGPNQTLAYQDADGNWVLNDPAPNYALELAKCQRYQVVYVPHGTWGIVGTCVPQTHEFYVANFDTPVPMRARPTISFAGNLRIVNTGYAQSAPQITNINTSANYMMQAGVAAQISTDAELTLGAPYVIWLQNGGRIIFDANL